MVPVHGYLEQKGRPMNLVFSLGLAIRRQTSISGPSQPVPPVNTVRPIIAGTVQQGQVLTADLGAWMGNPASYTRQWRRNGAAILGATAAIYMLQAADVGSTISVAVSAANAAGTTVATSVESAPVTAAGSDYFIVALQGQSGGQYAVAMDVNPYNPDGMLRPTITGSLGRQVMMEPSAPGGVVDRDINNTNFQTASGGYIVSRGAYAVAEFMKFLEPSKVPVILSLTKSGQSMEGLVRSDVPGGEPRDPWVFAEYKAAVDHVTTNYGDPDLLVTFWYGTSPTHINPVHWTGVLADGTAHIAGRRDDNTAGVPSISNYIMQPPGTTPFLGAFKQGPQGPKLAYAVHPNDNMRPGMRDNIRTFFEGARFDGMNLGQHTVSMSGHIEPSLTHGQPLQLLSVMGPAILRAAGVTVHTPTITGMNPAANGAFIDVTVNLPNGGNLTTTRAQRGMAAPAVLEPTYQPIFGFEFAGPSGAETTRATLLRSEWTPAITNAGTGTAPNRTGTVRLTRTTPVVSGDRLTYRQGGQGTAALGPFAPEDMVHLNYLIEEVPAWRQSGVEWPFPGIEVAPMSSMTTLSVGAGLAPLSSVMTGNTTSEPIAAPDGLVAGDRILLIAGANGSTVPGLPAGWTNIPIGGAGAAGGGNQISFRVITRIWQAGDTMPTIPNANYVDAQRFAGTFSIGTVASGFAAGGAAATAPAISPLTRASARHMVHVSARASGQPGFGTAEGLLPNGFRRISNIGGQRTTWIRPDPVTSIPAITMPVAFSSGSGGGVLAIEVVQP